MGSGFEPQAPHSLTWSYSPGTFTLPWLRLQSGLQLASGRASERPADAVGGVGHDLRQDVGVAGGHADLRVAENLHYDALVGAVGEPGSRVAAVCRASCSRASRTLAVFRSAFQESQSALRPIGRRWPGTRRSRRPASVIRPPCARRAGWRGAP